MNNERIAFYLLLGLYFLDSAGKNDSVIADDLRTELYDLTYSLPFKSIKFLQKVSEHLLPEQKFLLYAETDDKEE